MEGHRFPPVRPFVPTSGKLRAEYTCPRGDYRYAVRQGEQDLPLGTPCPNHPTSILVKALFDEPLKPNQCPYCREENIGPTHPFTCDGVKAAQQQAAERRSQQPMPTTQVGIEYPAAPLSDSKTDKRIWRKRRRLARKQAQVFGTQAVAAKKTVAAGANTPTANFTGVSKPVVAANPLLGAPYGGAPLPPQRSIPSSNQDQYVTLPELQSARVMLSELVYFLDAKTAGERAACGIGPNSQNFIYKTAFASKTYAGNFRLTYAQYRWLQDLRRKIPQGVK
jgi:hypothetical protein